VARRHHEVRSSPPGTPDTEWPATPLRVAGSRLSHGAARAFADALLPDELVAVVHLFRCRRCRQTLEAETTELALEKLMVRAGPRPAAGGMTQQEFDAMLARHEEAVVRALGLAALPAADLRPAIAGDPAARDPLVASGLVHLAEDALDDPARAVRLGDTAFATLAGQDADPGERNLRKLFRASWTVVRGHRLQGKLDQAEQA
jgi:hypothetical protein